MIEEFVSPCGPLAGAVIVVFQQAEDFLLAGSELDMISTTYVGLT